jgi:hypothetical protein
MAEQSGFIALFQGCCGPKGDAATQESFQTPKSVPGPVTMISSEPQAAGPTVAPPINKSITSMTQDAVDETEKSSEAKGPEAQAEERARLQEIVRAFAKQAVLGTPIEYLSQTGTNFVKEEGVYSLDKSLRRLSIPITKSDKKTFLLAEAVCGKTVQKPEVKDAADKGKFGNRIVRICVSADEYHLIFPDQKAADNFITCMKVLKLYEERLSSPQK